MTIAAESRFGRLTVIKEAEIYINQSGRRIRMFECLCDCGNTCTVGGWDLTKGSRSTKSCGCLHKETIKKQFTTHGMSKTNSYAIWAYMKDRCSNHKTPNYKNYGGRGIHVCKRWGKFENFYADMGERPGRMTIERIDNNENYSPSNCRWATRKEQARNTRTNHRISYKGKTKCIAEWAEDLGLNYKALWSRIQRHPNNIEAAFGGSPS